MENEKTNKVSFHMDIMSKKMIGTSESDESTDKNLARRIYELLAKSIENISTDWLKLFDEKMAEKEFQLAYEIFEKNRALLQMSINEDVLEKLKGMDVSKLDKLSRKDYLIHLVYYSSRLNKRENSEKIIEDILDEYKNDLEPLLIQNLFLEKANISSLKGNYNKASLIYKKILSSNDSDSGSIAWAYQGLSIISETEEDKINYAEKAADKHLEVGNKAEAVKNYLKISDIKSKYDSKAALDLIDKCISLYESNKLIDKELIASLKHKKAIYLHELGNSHVALTSIEEACEFRRGLIGNEIELHASLSLAEQISISCDMSDKASVFKTESENLSKIINDDNFLLRQEFNQIVSESHTISEQLMSKIIDSGDSSILLASLLYQSANTNLSNEEALGFLDEARIFVEKQSNNQILDIIYFAIAEKYSNEGMIEEAFLYYKKSLQNNNFYQPSAQNCAAMLFKNKRWKEAEDFIKERINFVGELPGTCFAYARALYENEKYCLALKYFKKSRSSVDNIENYISSCLENMKDEEIYNLEKENRLPEFSISATQFYDALEEFSISISSDSRMHFWDRDNESGKYKWTKNPEELSKQLLINFLNGKYRKDKIEILQETRAGVGFIDLYILLPGGLKIVVELKMCGNGYSSNYALSGESQIIHYQTNKSTKLGYLVVFDSRSRDFGKHFKKLQVISDHTIYSIAIDLRPEIVKNEI